MKSKIEPFNAVKALNTILRCLNAKRQDVLSKRQAYAADPAIFAKDIGTALLTLGAEVGLHPRAILAVLDEVLSDWYKPSGLNGSLVAGIEAHLGCRQALERARKMLAQQRISMTCESSFEHLTRAVTDLYHLAHAYRLPPEVLHQVAGDQLATDLVQAGRFEGAMKLLTDNLSGAH